MTTEPRVKDIMRDDFGSILPGATVHEAVEKLYVPDKNRDETGVLETQSLIVVDEDGNLEGLVTMFDILRTVVPPYLREAEHLTGISWEGLFGDAVHQAENRAVKDIMTPWRDVLTVGPEDRVMKVLELIVSEHVLRLPVCEERRVVGVVRLRDVFHEVGREMLRLKRSRE